MMNLRPVPISADGRGTAMINEALLDRSAVNKIYKALVKRTSQMRVSNGQGQELSQWFPAE
jgi:hypothetical protein